MMCASYSWDKFIQQTGANYWDTQIPEWVDAVPSMTNRREKAMLYCMTRDYPGEIRRIIDAGCFSGGSTLSFCRGLRDSNRPLTNNMIVSYDLFETDPISRSIFKQFNVDVEVGDSFLKNFIDVVGDSKNLVSIVKGSILDFAWSGGVIDILFLDVLKSQELNDHCAREFFPELCEGSLIFHQDYIHDPLPWIPITMAALDDHFQMFGWCKNTAVFRCIKEVSKAKISSVLGELKSASIGKKEELFKQILKPFPDGVPNINLSLSRVWMLVYHGDVARARTELAKISSSEEWVSRKTARLAAAIEKLEIN